MLTAKEKAQLSMGSWPRAAFYIAIGVAQNFLILTFFSLINEIGKINFDGDISIGQQFSAAYLFMLMLGSALTILTKPAREYLVFGIGLVLFSSLFVILSLSLTNTSAIKRTLIIFGYIGGLGAGITQANIYGLLSVNGAATKLASFGQSLGGLVNTLYSLCIGYFIKRSTSKPSHFKFIFGFLTLIFYHVFIHVLFVAFSPFAQPTPKQIESFDIENPKEALEHDQEEQELLRQQSNALISNENQNKGATIQFLFCVFCVTFAQFTRNATYPIIGPNKWRGANTLVLSLVYSHADVLGKLMFNLFRIRNKTIIFGLLFALVSLAITINSFATFDTAVTRNFALRCALMFGFGIVVNFLSDYGFCNGVINYQGRLKPRISSIILIIVITGSYLGCTFGKSLAKMIDRKALTLMTTSEKIEANMKFVPK